MLIVMSWFIRAICEETVIGLDGRVVTTSERESSMLWDSGWKPVKIEGEFTLQLEVSSTVKSQVNQRERVRNEGDDNKQIEYSIKRRPVTDDRERQKRAYDN